MPQNTFRQKESDLNRKVADRLKKLPRTMARKRRAGPFRKGMSDITGISHGFALELEGKLPGNNTTPIQRKWLRDCAQSGAITGVYYSLGEALGIVYHGLIARGVTIDPSYFEV